ncbi:hypothetical protein ETD86_02960 [Nonomuraea turkmeniaca]|uniref:LuxR family transcriptional regulator n=1 Tax=Nonomuraea turkmeniaca TaxID=103838 RepID=A0A5S4FW80_9ACTN|nr:ATP-binding protein [Nonomuraea turkmeniaca]TMR24902.1 hypothetical protein ETD86_02960 [Nonomuraea turkmeniaca]
MPESYLAALAVLNLLTETAEAGPVVMTAEDAHWLDPSTADVLAFLGRRLESEPILLLASARTGVAPRLDEAGLADLVLSPLSEQDAAALLDAHAKDLPAVHHPLIRSASTRRPVPSAAAMCSGLWPVRLPRHRAHSTSSAPGA